MKISIPIFIALLCLYSLTSSAQQKDKGQEGDYIIFEIVDNDPFEILTDSVLIIDFAQGIHKYSDNNNHFSIEKSDNTLLLYNEKYIPKIISIKDQEEGKTIQVKMIRYSDLYDINNAPTERHIQIDVNPIQVKIIFEIDPDKSNQEIRNLFYEKADSVTVFFIDAYLKDSLTKDKLRISEVNFNFNYKISNNILKSFIDKDKSSENLLEFVIWVPDILLKRISFSIENLKLIDAKDIDTTIYLNPENDFIGTLKGTYTYSNEQYTVGKEMDNLIELDSVQDSVSINKILQDSVFYSNIISKLYDSLLLINKKSKINKIKRNQQITDSLSNVYKDTLFLLRQEHRKEILTITTAYTKTVPQSYKGKEHSKGLKIHIVPWKSHMLNKSYEQIMSESYQLGLEFELSMIYNNKRKSNSALLNNSSVGFFYSRSFDVNQVKPEWHVSFSPSKIKTLNNYLNIVPLFGYGKSYSSSAISNYTGCMVFQLRFSSNQYKDTGINLSLFSQFTNMFFINNNLENNYRLDWEIIGITLSF